ncbi:unnamed protein product [Phaedon cochleariae]|uniref:Protein Wnt n=1 Tax=Phaedon cochleariae TaxID=80249 RepID=A0A9P0GQ89_PHACE|nr:unnamed protein product [Phaedon cochleariae]
MKILSRNNLAIISVVFFVYCLIDGDSGASSNKKYLRNGRGKSFVTVLFTKKYNNVTSNSKGLCRWLKGMKHQNKLCLNKEGLAEVIVDTRNIAIASCTDNFQYEQWSCMLQKKLFKKVYRETALLHSLSTSAFTYTVAKACAAGKLENCECASHGKSDNPAAWQWGGCGDNTRFARKFAYKFFQLRKKDFVTGDIVQSILKYNSGIGIEVVMKYEEKICKCQGFSGSCNYKICVKRIRSFNEIARELKNRYHSAIQVEPDNSIVQIQKERFDGHLVYLENSPNFCTTTVGRRCKDADNCATLCCGRGFATSSKTVKEICNPRWRNESIYEVKWDICEREEVVYSCQ